MVINIYYFLDFAFCKKTVSFAQAFNRLFEKAATQVGTHKLYTPYLAT